MGRTAIISPRVSDTAVITTGSGVVGSALASNLLNPRSNSYWQSLGQQPILDINIPNPPAGWNPDALFIGYLNGGGSVQGRKIEIRRAATQAALGLGPYWGSSDQYPGGIPVDNGVSGAFIPYARPHFLYTFNSTNSGMWFRLIFYWGTAVDSYVRAARLVIGQQVVPDIGASGGWVSTHEEKIVEAEDIGGGLSARARGARRTLKAEWPAGSLTDVEGTTIQETLLERGSARDLVLCLDTIQVANYQNGSGTIHPMAYTALGRVKSPVDLKHVPRIYRSTSFGVEETGVTEMTR